VFSPLNEDGEGDIGSSGDAMNVDDHRLSLTTQLLLHTSQQVNLTTQLYTIIGLIIIIIIRHAPCQCVAPLATNSLHSDLSKHIQL